MALTKLTKDNAAAVTTTSEAGDVQADLDSINEKLRYITPEMFGAVGDGVQDDTAAIQAAIDELKTLTASTQIIGNGNYAISDSLKVANFAYGFRLYLRSLRAMPSWPAYSDWKNAKPLISIGGSGSMVGLNIESEFVDGADKADWINIIGQGCGGSHFHAEQLRNVVCGVVPKSITWPTASNKITGGYWHDSMGTAFLLQRGTSGTSPVVEGWVLDVNFVTGFNNGGIMLRHGSQYANIRGQFDFNGRHLSEHSMSSTTISGLTRGDILTNGTNTAEVIAFYEFPLGTYKLLLAEGHNVSADGSYFAVGSTLQKGDSSWSSTITATRIPSVGNWFPDIIHDFTGSSFGKCIISSPYCGGIVGGLLHSSVFFIKMSSTALDNGVNGAQWVHSTSVLSLRDVIRDNYVMDFAEKFMAPYRHLYMRGYRIYGSEVGVTLVQSTTTSVRTFTFVGDGTVTNSKEVYRATVSGQLSGVSGEVLVYVSSTGITLVNNTVTGLSLSTNGMVLTAVQGSQANLFAMFNFQRIL